MATEIQFPSSRFPGFPEVSVELPEAWSPVDAAGAILAGRREVEDGEFIPNVVVRVQRTVGWRSLADAVPSIDTAIDSLPEVVDIGREMTTSNGHGVYRREYSYVDPEAGTLVQAIYAHFVPRDDVADLVEAAASASASQATELWGEVRELLSSLTIRID